MSKSTTKRSLLVSVLALVMCVAMLVGTTFAWFTDSASTSVNKIEAGKLKLELLDKNGNPLAENQALVWETKDNKVLWEPNCTYNLEQFQIKNAGNLALKYKVTLKATKIDTTADGKSLLDVIDWTIKLGNETLKVTSEQIKDGLGNGIVIITDQPLLANKVDTISVSGHMREDAGNDYQGLTIDGFGISVVAAQYTYENDSTGNEYDKNAQYGDVAYVSVKAPTEEEITAGVNPLANALTSAAAETDAATGEVKQKITADLGAGEFTLKENEGKVNAVVKGKDITLAGAGKQETTYKADKGATAGASDGGGASDYSFDGAKSVVFKDMTVEFKAVTGFQGFVRAGGIRFENCIIKGMGACWGVGDVVFDNCEFVFTEEYDKDTYNLWTYAGSSFTFNNCTFTSNNGKFINVYRQENPSAIVDITLNNCKFINTGDAANKAALNIKSQCAWNVTINNCTTEGNFPEANNGLWQSKPDYGTEIAGNTVTVTP